jgi:hypothetical protein
MTGTTNPVTWFEIPATDLARAKSFYEAILDVKLSVHDLGPLQMAWFPSDEGGPGAAGSLVKAKSYIPSHAGTMVYFTVKDIESTLQRITANGGKVLNPKQNIGEYGFVAHFEDTEGNRVALHSV